jgi:hypothetical protein
MNEMLRMCMSLLFASVFSCLLCGDGDGDGMGSILSYPLPSVWLAARQLLVVVAVAVPCGPSSFPTVKRKLPSTIYTAAIAVANAVALPPPHPIAIAFVNPPWCGKRIHSPLDRQASIVIEAVIACHVCCCSSSSSSNAIFSYFSLVSTTMHTYQ